MNTTLTPTTRHDLPQVSTAVETHSPPAARRLGVFDRAALHLGVALIRWGRRPGRELARHERRANVYELALLQRELDRARREFEAERAHSYNALARIR